MLTGHKAKTDPGLPEYVLKRIFQCSLSAARQNHEQCCLQWPGAQRWAGTFPETALCHRALYVQACRLNGLENEKERYFGCCAFLRKFLPGFGYVQPDKISVTDLNELSLQCFVKADTGIAKRKNSTAGYSTRNFQMH